MLCVWVCVCVSFLVSSEGGVKCVILSKLCLKKEKKNNCFACFAIVNFLSNYVYRTILKFGK